MSGTADESPDVVEFLKLLELMPWFRNIGGSISPDKAVERISKWEGWPGPEEPSVAVFHDRLQSLYDEITQAVGEDMQRPFNGVVRRYDEFTQDVRQGLPGLWDRIHTVVLRIASRAVPFDPEQDAWHAPTAAVWQAAVTAGLLGLCLQTGRPVPAELEEQFDWFARGHWPCGYAGRTDRRLVVF